MAKFTCVQCGYVGDTIRSEAEAMAEFKADFPDADHLSRSTICGDCHAAFQEWMKANGLTGRLEDDRAKLASLKRLN